MKKVLIVDDAMFMRHTLKTMLEKNNYQIIGMAEDGEEAVMRCKELSPDIITLDITMPKMSGLQALVEIKEFNKDIKVVMITAMGQEMLIKEALLNGANNFIVKPFREKTIIDILNSL